MRPSSRMIRLTWIVIGAVLMLALGLAAHAAPASIVYRTWEGGEFLKENQRIVDAFNKENPDIKVVLSTVADNYDQKLQVELASGTAPDVFQLSAEFVAAYGQRGVLLELGPYFQKSTKLKVQDFYEPLQRQYAPGGKVYGMSNAVEIVVIFYNKKVFDRAGVPYPPSDEKKPWTWDEFLTVARRLTIDDKGRNALDPGFDPEHIVQWGINGTSGWVFYYMPLVWSNGGSLFTDDGSRLALDSPEALDALQKAADLVHKYRVAPRSQEYEQLGMNSLQMFVEGKMAMIITGTWNIYGVSVERDFHDWDVTFLPVLKTGKLYTTIPQSGYSIAANTKHPEAAFRFLEYLLLEQGQTFRASVGNVLPSLNRMLASEGQKGWVHSDVHPPHFAQVILPYMKHGRLLTPMGYFPQWWPKVIDTLDSEMAPLWSGKATAGEVVKKLTLEVNKLIAAGK